VPAGLPLVSLLSQAFVAYTIELDNECEHRMPHKTTQFGRTGKPGEGPWLVSMAMWWTCMRFVDDEGITASDLYERARAATYVSGMIRWGYVSIGPDEKIRPTDRGKRAQKTWLPLFSEIEERWEARFGKRDVDKLRTSLRAVVGEFDVILPDCLPILGYMHACKGRVIATPRSDGERKPDLPGTPLVALIAKVVLAFALLFERDSKLSLALCANALRRIDERGSRVRDLPALCGISKPAMATCVKHLERGSLAAVSTDPSDGRTKIVELNAKGVGAKRAYERRIREIELRWRERIGAKKLDSLRAAAERITGTSGDGARLLSGLKPYTDNWRAKVRPIVTLPHFPMVLFRGGYPDGS